MTAARTSLLVAAAALAAGCAGTPELTGAAAARSRGAAVEGESAATAPPAETASKGPVRPTNPWMDESQILAKVNGQVITLRLIRQIIGPAYEHYLNELADLDAIVKARVREQVIRRLVIDEGNRIGKRIGLAVTDDEFAREEERSEREARKRGSTVALTIKDLGMSRREWDQNLRDDILFGRTKYYLTGLMPDGAYSEDIFRPCVDSYVSPVEVRAWGERNRDAIDVPESVLLRVLCVSAGDFAGDGVSGADALRKCGEALDAFEARLRAGEPFAKLADEGHRYPGAAEGGLIGPVRRDSPVLEEFREWAFAPGRKVGDVSARMRRSAGFVVLLLEKRDEAVHPDIEEWGARERIRMEFLRRSLAWAEVRARLLEEGSVSPAAIRSDLLEDARSEARRLRGQLDPVDPPRTASDPAR